MASCSSRENAKQKNGVWNDFVSKIERRDIEYLTINSFDSIVCNDCTENDSGQLYSNKLIFNKHLNNLYNKDYLKDRDYSVFQDSTKIRISYLDDKELLDVERSTTVYMFDLYDGKYLFSGMITIP